MQYGPVSFAVHADEGRGLLAQTFIGVALETAVDVLGL